MDQVAERVRAPEVEWPSPLAWQRFMQREPIAAPPSAMALAATNGTRSPSCPKKPPIAPPQIDKRVRRRALDRLGMSGFELRHARTLG